jgi:PRC-barrel domain
VGFLVADAGAQGAPQTIEIARVDVQKVAAGFRASKVIGSKVLNEANETIGKIDDLLVTRDGREPYAVLSIGGFLGMGTHLVVVRYDSLKFAGNKIVLPGGTKDGLKMLPAFQYSKP